MTSRPVWQAEIDAVEESLSRAMRNWADEVFDGAT